MIYLQTKKCIINGCKQNAVSFTGHFHMGSKIVDAGFCNNDQARAYFPAKLIHPVKGCNMRSGCFGKWKRQFGVEEYKP